ncbi:hypothetical protein [Corynebacterium sphenisci]|uniref:hypothetical protein n=1 Tax=Corynebacterium sphenisci TaxID=191493 RepID=UPI0026E01983|nr:hypothetical protein [Corynebacterium sphenisci]MDO5731186.1 hypothetical protein [Corynebacterium sphenisci]
MLHALSYAFVDSINVLLIGVVVALGVLAPAGVYRRVTPLLIAGDWLGVLVPAAAVLLVFDGLGERVRRLVESPAFGILLVATGVLTGVLTLRGGGTPRVLDRILAPLLRPSILTVGTGFVLGAVQSLTSVPFFAGLAVLSAEGLPAATRYLGLIAYACLALSLPTAAAAAVGAVRRRPASAAGRVFAAARANQAAVARGAGYVVSALLILIGGLQLG